MVATHRKPIPKTLAMQPMAGPVGPPDWALLLPPIAGVVLAHAAFRRR